MHESKSDKIKWRNRQNSYNSYRNQFFIQTKSDIDNLADIRSQSEKQNVVSLSVYETLSRTEYTGPQTSLNEITRHETIKSMTSKH